VRLRRLLALAPTVAVAGGLAACGGGGSSSPAAGDPATAVPANVPLFVEGQVQPQGSVKESLDSSLSKLLGTDDPGGMIVGALDRSLRRDGLEFSRDIQPWLGERAGVFYESFGSRPKVGIVAQTTDPKAAQEMIRKAAGSHGVATVRYRGETIEQIRHAGFATVGNLLIGGSTGRVAQAEIDAVKGSSLADSNTYTSSVTDVPSNSVFSAWVDPARVIDELAREGQLPSGATSQVRSGLGRLASQPVVVWGDASPSYLAIEASWAASPAAATPQSSSLLGDLPDDSWLALAVHETADQVKRSFGESTAAASLGAQAAPFLRALSRLGLDPATLSKWVGDVSGFLRGESILGLGGALVVKTRDEAASAKTLARIEAALRRDRDLVVSPLGGGQTGFTMTPRQAPIQVVFTQRQGKVVIGLGQDSVNAALHPPRSLSESPGYKDATAALGSGVTPELYLDFQPLASLFEVPGVINDPEFKRVEPYLQRLDYVVAGAGESGDRSLVRFALGVRGGHSSGSGSISAAGLPKYAAMQP
jgi:uncharacterized protein DUF3352